MNNRELYLFSNTLKQDIVIMLNNAKSGHSAGAIGLSEIFSVLYNNILNVDSKNPQNPNRDFLFLSNAHVCPVLYATLANKGFFPKEELNFLRKLNSKLQGHPHINSVPGIENTGGPLGQGISQAVGLASVLKREGKKNKVFCVVGDGELEEGQCWEAFMYSAKEKLDNLYIIVDRNHIQIDGTTDEVMHLEPLHKKFSSFNYYAISFDGNNIEQIKTAFKEALNMKGKPKVLIAKTKSGKGISFMEGKFEWHGKVPNDNETKIALEELKNLREKY